ncbi:MAG: NAD(P)H-dependent glycerol-3-phosphate dehydrogenase [Syntrophomonadaceae bacterium]
MKKICVLGAGSWGTALAALLGKNDYRVTMWGRVEDGVEQIASLGENRRFLPGVVVPDTVMPTADMAKAMTGADWVVLSVPSQAMRTVLLQAEEFLKPDTYLINTAKGLEIATGMRMGQVFEDVLGPEIIKRYAVLSGPSHAEEVGRTIPTAVTVASSCKETAFLAQDLFMAPSFRVYTNPDVAGVELGGALKNVIALATGVAYGLGYGDNTMAALMTRGLTEIIRMGTSLGGDPRTFIGLSGLGDLVVTCGSRHSRNRRAGELIGQGLSLEEALEQVGMVVEGAPTCRIVHKMALERGIDMPITRACYQVLYEHREPREAVLYLMQRQRKNETEDIGGLATDW